MEAGSDRNGADRSGAGRSGAGERGSVGDRPEAGAESRPGLGNLRVDKFSPTYGHLWQKGRKFGYGAPKEAPAERRGAASGETEPALPFVHLHVHSNFSFLDGGSRVTELTERAAALGQPALALTDHDGLYGAVRFAESCEKHGIKAIFGVEIWTQSLLPNSMPATSLAVAESLGPYHLVLLAETREGYANLCGLVSDIHLSVPERDRHPTATRDMLERHRHGVICLTGCRQGEVGRLVDAGREREAARVLLELRKIFGADNVFVELEHFGYVPHQEAQAGQGGAVYQKVRGDDGRLRHHEAGAGAYLRRDPGFPNLPPRDPALRRPAPRQSLPEPDGRPAAGSSPRDPASTASSQAQVQKGRDAKVVAKKLAPKKPERPRADLPDGYPQHLNPADYDVGFHRDGSPWKLSCLKYCHRLLKLAHACGLAAVLTTNAHYAAPDGRDLHLVCRAAGRDEPLSDYPEAASGRALPAAAGRTGGRPSTGASVA